MNVDLKLALSRNKKKTLPLALLTFKTFLVIHVARKDGYRIEGFIINDDDIMTIATQSLLFKQENEQLLTDTTSSRFDPTITDAELVKHDL